MPMAKKRLQIVRETDPIEIVFDVCPCGPQIEALSSAAGTITLEIWVR